MSLCHNGNRTVGKLRFLWGGSVPSCLGGWAGEMALGKGTCRHTAKPHDQV